MIAAQRRRRSLDDLIEHTPADGLVGGVGTVNGELFDRQAPCRWSRCRTTTRCSPAPRACRTTARRTGCSSSPNSCGCRSCSSPRAAAGGRATPTASASAASTASRSAGSASCRGTVPLVGVNAGYCFAGNAAILGCCDVVIATEDSNIGMGGPAMIEGGGLGVYEPTDDRPDRGAACQRRRRHRGGRRGRGRRRRRSSTCRTSRAAVGEWRRAPTRGAARRRPRRPAAGYDVRRVDRRAVRHRLGARAPPRVRRRA